MCLNYVYMQHICVVPAKSRRRSFGTGVTDNCGSFARAVCTFICQIVSPATLPPTPTVLNWNLNVK